jgi:hypothetical protein
MVCLDFKVDFVDVCNVYVVGKEGSKSRLIVIKQVALGDETCNLVYLCDMLAINAL